MELTGIGVGRGIAAGPIKRMPEPLAEPADIQRTADAETEIAAAQHSLAEVAQWLRERGVKATTRLT